VTFDAFLGRKLPLTIHHFWGKTGICPIIETVVFLGRQNIPLRGHRNDGLLGGLWPPAPPLYPPLLYFQRAACSTFQT